MRKLVLLLLAVVAVAGSLGACGGDGGSSGDEVVLGDGGGQERVDSQKAKIAKLEQKLRKRKAAAARRAKAATAPVGEGAGADLSDASAEQSFEQLEAGLGGQAGVTIGRVGDPESRFFGSLPGGSAWSTIKLAIAAQVLSEAGGPTGLDSADDDLIRKALTASDNAAAAALFEKLSTAHGGVEGAAAAVEQPLRAAGDTATAVSTQGRGEFSPYGQTEWSLVDQHRFVSRLVAGCVPDSASAEHIAQLMGQVVSDQQWGLGSVGIPARYKGGWGPGLDGRYLVRQVGVLELDGASNAVVVTMAALPDDGQLGTGQQMLDEIAAWVVEYVDPAKATLAGC